MLDKVEATLAELKKQQREEYYKKKNADLAQWGLDTQKKGKKAAPVVVTDEEYEALIDASVGVGMPTRNGFARVLNVAALIVVAAGIILGFVVANSNKELSFPIFMGIVIGAVLIALIFLGIGEALRLLQQIADIQRIDHSHRQQQIQKAFPDEQPDVPQSFTVETLDEVPTHPYHAAAVRSQDAPEPAQAEDAPAQPEDDAPAQADDDPEKTEIILPETTE